MARKTRSRRGRSGKSARDKRLAQILAGTVVAFLLLAASLALPNGQALLFEWFGIAPRAEVPLVRLDELGADVGTAVHVVDVGQGDAVLLQSGGEYALVDAGPPEGEEALLAYLEAVGVGRLRYLVMTHPHADHIGGMQAVAERYAVDEVLLPDFALGPLPTTALFENLLATLTNAGLTARTMAAGDSYPLGSGSIDVLAGGLASEDNLNLICPALLFESEGLRFLDTGDAEAANEDAWLAAGASLGATVFKAGHHGSRTSNDAAFLATVAPELVVVSCGVDNRYGHPHSECLDTYTNIGAETLRTDLDGTVVCCPDGEGGVLAATAAGVAGQVV